MTVHDSADHSGAELAEFRHPLLALYGEIDAEIARLAPGCQLSGRCCRFEEYGHTLFISAPEAALLVAEAPAPARPLDGGASCPWQSERGLCMAREVRPIGCRVYFCDPAYEPHAAAISETYLGRLKRLVEALKLSWNYAPLHHHLLRAQADGRFPEPT